MVEAKPGRRASAVTGGIGAGIVVALTKRDFDVIVCDRTIDPAAATLRAQVAPGARLSFVSGDFGDIDDHSRFVEAIFGAFGHLECLVNNAGVSVKSRGDLLEVSAESYDLTFGVNTGGAFFLTPINRRGTPEDVGRAVATMASGDLPFTTGAAIQAGGDMHIHQYYGRPTPLVTRSPIRQT